MLPTPPPFDAREFRASMQLRTPRRVLLRHGEVHADPALPPPQIATEVWQGRWVVRRPDAEGRPGQASGYAGHLLDRVPSDAGRVEPRDYLPFLLAVRAVVESDRPVADRRQALAAELAEDAWHGFVVKLGGVDEILGRFFPAFISTLDVRNATQAGFRRRGLVTAAQILAATDHELLTVSGIGELTAAKCRARCAQAPDPHAEFVDQVMR
jgi:hypothetical protein